MRHPISTTLLISLWIANVAIGSELCHRFELARTKQLTRRPQEAIELYRKIIESNRDCLEYSAPALVHMVECFQLLKGAPNIEKQYKEMVGKYLSKLPLLDGVSKLDRLKAEDDLLWKPWAGKTAPSPGRRMKGERRPDAVVSKGRIQLRLYIGARNAFFDVGSEFTPAVSFRLEIEAESTMRITRIEGPLNCIAEGLDQQKYASSTPYTHLNPIAAWSSFNFGQIPTHLDKFKSIKGEIRVHSARSFVKHPIELQKDARLDLKDEKIALISLSSKNHIYNLAVERVDSSPSAFTGGMSGGFPNRPFSLGPPYLLLLSNGKTIEPVQRSHESSGGKTLSRLTFETNEQPEKLVYVTVGATSSRLFPFEFKHVALP